MSHYQFEHWQFEPDKDQLTDMLNGEVLKLEPQVALLLRVLIEDKDRVISKEALSEHLWPNTIVEDNSLYQLLTKLRRLLNDKAKNPRIIKTVPKKGYCFIARVNLVEDIADSLPDQARAGNLRSSVTASFNPLSSRTLSYKILFFKKVSNRVWSNKWWLAFAFLCSFSAIAYFSTPHNQPNKFVYQSSQVTSELGLEGSPAAHPQQEILAYIKNGDSLWFKSEDHNMGDLKIYQSDSELKQPSWSETGKLLALWQHNSAGCQLKVFNIQGESVHQSPEFNCVNAGPVVWQSDNELVLSIKTQFNTEAYLYKIDSRQRITLPIPLAQNEYLVAAIRAWAGQVYYLVSAPGYVTRLINIRGDQQVSWPYPIKLIGFDSRHQRLIVNNKTLWHGLDSIDIYGNSVAVAQTEQGLFSAISVKSDGDFYATIENWQVNIRDKDNLPLFASSSIDYLPVTNALGETVFMSKRDGICQVYFHQNGQLTQLSIHKGYERVNFLSWSPDLAYILSNRDNKVVIYSRAGLEYQFELNLFQGDSKQSQRQIVGLGWINDQTIYSYDGKQLSYYDLDGNRIRAHRLSAEKIYFDVNTRLWWIFNNKRLSAYSEHQLASLSAPPASERELFLSKEQGALISNVRLRNNALYWQSHIDRQDYIWQLSLADKKSTPKLIERGKTIWHYDIGDDGQLVIAARENTEGDIKLFKLENAE